MLFRSGEREHTHAHRDAGQHDGQRSVYCGGQPESSHRTHFDFRITPVSLAHKRTVQLFAVANYDIP